MLTTLTGRDRPGITAAFFAALAAHDVNVRDIEQVVIRDRLILTVLFDFRGDPAALRNSVTTTAGELGMECDVAVASQGERMRRRTFGPRSHVIVLGHPGKVDALRRFAHELGVPMSQTVAVGAGGTDSAMLASAGLGIAFNPRAAVRAAADPALRVPYLDTVLFVLGISRAEIDAGEL